MNSEIEEVLKRELRTIRQAIYAGNYLLLAIAVFLLYLLYRMTH